MMQRFVKDWKLEQKPKRNNCVKNLQQKQKLLGRSSKCGLSNMPNCLKKQTVRSTNGSDVGAVTESASITYVHFQTNEKLQGVASTPPSYTVQKVRLKYLEYLRR